MLGKVIPGHVLQEPGGAARFSTGAMPCGSVVTERHELRSSETPRIKPGCFRLSLKAG